MTRSRRRLLAALAAVLAAVLGIWWLLFADVERSGGTGDPGALFTDAMERADQSYAEPGSAELPAVAPAAAEGAARAAPPVVDEIRVSKTSVCEGEEVLVSVRAHTTDGNDAFLRYRVGAVRGQVVPIRLFRMPDEEDRPSVVVSSKTTSTTVPLPKVEIRDCRPVRFLRVHQQAVMNTIDEHEFWVTIHETPPSSHFEPVRFVWSFGDGAEQTTTVPRVTHDYSGRAQKTEAAPLLVTVTAIDAAGVEVEGHLALELLNLGFANKAHAGTIPIFAQGTPRFPVQDDDGVTRQTFRIWHSEDQPVEITRVTVRKRKRSPENGFIPDPSPRVEIDHTRLFENTDIPPGRGLQQPFQYDFGRAPEVYVVDVDLAGRSADGLPARGHISLMRPSPKPTRDNSAPVSDPETMARVMKAMSILGQETVTQEDMDRLEREGRLTVSQEEVTRVMDGGWATDHPPEAVLR